MEPGFLDKITWTSSTPIYAMVNLVILDQFSIRHFNGQIWLDVVS